MARLNRAVAEFQCELAGNGPPVLIIQGVDMIGEGWRPQADGLTRNFQTLSFDNRGIGRNIPCRGKITLEAMAANGAAR